MNALYPERFSDSDAERLASRPPTRRAAARGPRSRAALSEHRRAARSTARQLDRLRGLVSAPVRTLPFIFEPELGAGRAARARRGGLSVAERRRDPRGKEDLHLRRLGRRRQDDDVGGDRGRDGRAGQEGRGADDRPGEAARRLARAARAGKRGAAGRPGAVRAAGNRDRRRRAVGDDARRQGDVRRGRSPSTRPTPRPATASSPTGSTASSRTRSPARRSTWRWSGCSSSTRRTATTCSSSTPRRAATRSTSSMPRGA